MTISLYPIKQNEGRQYNNPPQPLTQPLTHLWCPRWSIPTLPLASSPTLLSLLSCLQHNANSRHWTCRYLEYYHHPPLLPLLHTTLSISLLYRVPNGFSNIKPFLTLQIQITPSTIVAFFFLLSPLIFA